MEHTHPLVAIVAAATGLAYTRDHDKIREIHAHTVSSDLVATPATTSPGLSVRGSFFF
jgi:hypothetical protein